MQGAALHLLVVRNGRNRSFDRCQPPWWDGYGLCRSPAQTAQ